MKKKRVIIHSNLFYADYIMEEEKIYKFLKRIVKKHKKLMVDAVPLEARRIRREFYRKGERIKGPNARWLCDKVVIKRLKPTERDVINSPYKFTIKVSITDPPKEILWKKDIKLQ